MGHRIRQSCRLPRARQLPPDKKQFNHAGWLGGLNDGMQASHADTRAKSCRTLFFMKKQLTDSDIKIIFDKMPEVRKIDMDEFLRWKSAVEENKNNPLPENSSLSPFSFGNR